MEKGGKAFCAMDHSYKKCMLYFYPFDLTLHVDLFIDISHIDDDEFSYHLIYDKVLNGANLGGELGDKLSTFVSISVM